MEILDILNQPVVEGDLIAAGFRSGNNGELRIGYIEGFGERGNNTTVKVHWVKGSGYGGRRQELDIHGAIEADLFRFVKITVNGD